MYQKIPLEFKNKTSLPSASITTPTDEFKQEENKKEHAGVHIPLAYEDEDELEKEHFNKRCFWTMKGEERVEYFKEVLSAAEKGNLNAQFVLSQLYQFGRGTDVNYPASLQWLERSANAGHAQAQFELGTLFATSEYSALFNIDVDLERARLMFEKAVENNYIKAIHALASLYERLENDAESLKYDLLGAKRGLDESQLRLARRFEEGRGVERNMAKAISLYHQSAEDGLNADILGDKYEWGKSGFPQDIEQAARWYRRQESSIIPFYRDRFFQLHSGEYPLPSDSIIFNTGAVLADRDSNDPMIIKITREFHHLASNKPAVFDALLRKEKEPISILDRLETRLSSIVCERMCPSGEAGVI